MSITSIEKINMNLEEGRLLYAALSLLRDFVVESSPEGNEHLNIEPQQIFEGVMKRQKQLFPEVNQVSSILSETGEPFKL